MLCLLWRGSLPTLPIPELSWMMLALAGLAGLTVIFGLLLEPITRLLDVGLADNGPLRVLGLIAALAGLAAGWTGLAERAIAPVRTPAAAGFRLAGGWSSVAVRAALALAQVTHEFDAELHNHLLATGRLSLSFARRPVSRIDAGLDRTVARVGAAGLTLGLASRRFDESDLDGIIAALVQAVRNLGAIAPQLQSGFVSRELALAAIGAGAVLILLLLLGQCH
jgi:hypothetical protein